MYIVEVINLEENKKLREIIEVHGDNLYRICIIMLGNRQDAEDIMQELFIKYIQKAPRFIDDNHERAWLIRCVNNLCKDMLRFRKRYRYENIDDLELGYMMDEDKLVLKEIMALSRKYKEVLLLYYLEGYKVGEIANMMKINQSSVRKRLERGRKLLKNNLKEEIL